MLRERNVMLGQSNLKLGYGGSSAIENLFFSTLVLFFERLDLDFLRMRSSKGILSAKGTNNSVKFREIEIATTCKNYV